MVPTQVLTMKSENAISSMPLSIIESLYPQLGELRLPGAPDF